MLRTALSCLEFAAAPEAEGESVSGASCLLKWMTEEGELHPEESRTMVGEEGEEGEEGDAGEEQVESCVKENLCLRGEAKSGDKVRE